ncbi:MAG TPA: molybdopterin-guanine dinucleotide biosynthesis protein B [Firmicutes bacterium]|nr:molybdopterin-guanine dinucleotide biosynthesis protein B [Bacillota bacterium]
MVPFISVVGRGSTGKTTLIVNIIRELRLLGYRVAVIKHDPDEHGVVDRPGSDTWLFQKEGGQAVILASPSRVALFRRTESEKFPEELFPLCGDVDLIILEGYKKRDYPKLFLWSEKKERLDPDPLWDLRAVVYAREEEEGAIRYFKDKSIPLFCRDDSKKIAHFIEKYILEMGGGGKGGR